MTFLLVMAALAAPAAPQPAPPPAPAPAPVLTSWESCEVCKGAGKVTVREPDLGQNAGRIGNKQPKKTVVCPVCEGKGRFECYRKPADLEMQMMHEREQNVAERGEPCVACHWTGLNACKDCNGCGLTVCKAKDCSNGWIVTKTTKTTRVSRSGGYRNNRGSWGGSSGGNRNTTRTETKITVSECPQCRGVGKVRCTMCGGKRATPCKKCGGIGTRPRRKR